MQTILLITHVVIASTLIVLVLLQQGKGADAGAAFGSGASATVFGSGGTASFLTRVTAVLAALFFIISLSLAYLSGQKDEEPRSVIERIAPAQTETTAPAETTMPRADDVPALPADTAPVADVPQAPADSAPVADVPALPAEKSPASNIPQDVPN